MIFQINYKLHKRVTTIFEKQYIYHILIRGGVVNILAFGISLTSLTVLVKINI